MGAGLRLAECVREALLAAPTEPGVDSGEVAQAEVLALWSLLLNLHFRAAKGERVTEAEMRGSEWRLRGRRTSRAVSSRKRNLTGKRQPMYRRAEEWRSGHTRKTRKLP